MRKEIYKLIHLGTLFFSCLLSAKESDQILIVYSATALQNPVYEQVIKGIERVSSHTQRLEVISGGVNFQALLDQNHSDRVIGLGKDIVDSIYKTTFRVKTLAGLMYFKPNDYNGVSLSLDNRVLIERLSRFLPSINRIFIVQQTHYQTVDYIPSDLNSSPKIEIREGVDSLDTIRVLGQLLESVSSSDAVLIPANLPTNILYEVAKVGWERKVVLISTNLSHLESGALIAAYPDDVALGEQLGLLAIRNDPVYESIKSIKFGLNKRVAQHLAIEFTPSVLDEFAIKIK
jgi:hypothetical protein